MFSLNAKLSGVFKVHVVNADGTLAHEGQPQSNLILEQGMDRLGDSASMYGAISWAAAGTGTTPTKDNVSGTASQTGTTITLSGSSYSFVSGDVGSYLKWTSGAEAKITAFTNSTTVTAGVSQTVASGTLVGIFRCSQTALVTEVKRTGGASTSTSIWPAYADSDGLYSQGIFTNATNGTVTFKRTLDFTAETGTVVYTEVGMAYSATSPGNLFSRILLANPVTVLNTQKLRVQYYLTVKYPYAATAERPTNLTLGISGWPVAYNIASITSNSTTITATTSAAHHFIVGSKVNFLGSDVPAYNAEWTIATVPTSTTFTITSALNPGTASAVGTCFLNTKANAYLSQWGVGGVGSSTTNHLGSGTYPAGSGLPAWWSGSNTVWDSRANGSSSNIDSTNPALLLALCTAIIPGATADNAFSGLATVAQATLTRSAYTAGNFYVDYTTSFASGAGNSSAIKALLIYNSGTIGLSMVFEELQKKDSSSSLSFTFRRSWSRTLA